MSFWSEIKVTSDSLIYFDNYVIIDDRASLDKTFVTKRYYPRYTGVALINT